MFEGFEEQRWRKEAGEEGEEEQQETRQEALNRDYLYELEYVDRQCT